MQVITVDFFFTVWMTVETITVTLVYFYLNKNISINLFFGQVFCV